MTYQYAPFAPAPVDPRFPLFGATFGQAISRSFAHIFRFSGQASRSEFWWAMLFFAILRLVSNLQAFPIIIAGALAEEAGPAFTDALYVPSLLSLLAYFAIDLVLIVPTLSIGWRRLRDAGIPGGLSLLSLIPLLGSIAVFVMAAMPSKLNLPAPPRQ